MNPDLRMLKLKRTQPETKIFSIKKIKNQKKWTREEDELLIALAEKYNEKHWKEISKRFVKKNSLQCFSRYKRIRPGIVKGSWKKDEDIRIIELVTRYGKSWSKISKILGTRNGKQIRDRFINVLDPEIKKGKFTDEEDRKLISLYKQHGPKWATIAKYYTNRTADMIKNRFHSSIKKKLFDTESYSDLKEYRNEDLVIAKQESDESYRSSKFFLTLALNYGHYSTNSHTDELVIQSIEHLENKNYHSTKECISEYYNSESVEFNDLLNFNGDMKVDDTIYENGTYIWNFEDYFTI
jgi:hypothetical protein